MILISHTFFFIKMEEPKKDEESIYLEVTGEPKKKYRKLVNAVSALDSGNFVQSLYKFTFNTTTVHHHSLHKDYIKSDIEYHDIVNLYDIETEICAGKVIDRWNNERFRINCICSEKLKYLYLWKHKKVEKRIVIGCVCFENLYKFIINVYGHLPELMEHIKILKKQFMEAKRKIHYKECKECGKLNVHIEQDIGFDICICCREQKEIQKQRKINNRKCFKCKENNIPKSNRTDICCTLCITIHKGYNCIDCSCGNRVYIVPKKVLYNNKYINGCNLTCDAWGCRPGTIGIENPIIIAKEREEELLLELLIKKQKEDIQEKLKKHNQEKQDRIEKEKERQEELEQELLKQEIEDKLWEEKRKKQRIIEQQKHEDEEISFKPKQNSKSNKIWGDLFN